MLNKQLKKCVYNTVCPQITSNLYKLQNNQPALNIRFKSDLIGYQDQAFKIDDIHAPISE